ncbi:MAG: protein kinase [Deltaproteobacteria bacterium]|nr:protein kinase [Deltaproteobacteria bacterium]
MKKPVPFGKYYLLDRISVGGMAEVFKAKSFGVEGFERLLAVKRILPSIAEDEEFITMFIDEAKIAVQLTHANIAQIFDLGKVGDAYFIAMEYVEGKDLRAIFDRMRKKGQTVPIPMAAYVTMKMCEGLDYAHNKKDTTGQDLNLVHRDVSPQNILVSFDGQVKVIDFGIAKAAGKAGKTQAGILKGKFGYMSPEQVRGMPLDRRSDIFAVGIVLWELLTGERLFIGESDFSTLEKVRNVDIVPPSTFNKRIPADLEKIILKTLSKEVADRYQSAMDLHDDLQSWMYTSGSFFSRKDLAAFQAEVFRDDIEKIASQNEKIDENLLRSSVPPPPTPAAPRVTAPPAPPRPGGATMPPSPPRSTAVPAPPRATAIPPGPPRPTAPGSAAPPMPSPKATMLGMPAVNVQTTSPTLPPDLSGGRVASAQKPAVNMEWDDDEEPTNILNKNTAAQMAAATNRPAPTQPAPAPVQHQSAPMPFPQRESSSQKIPYENENSTGGSSKGNKALVIGIAAGILVAIILSMVVYKLIGKSSGGGTIELNITPGDELTVIVDGTNKVPQNVSPMIIDNLSEGEHSFIIKREGYDNKELIFNVSGNKVLASNVQLEAAAAPASGFYLETDPPGCTIEVDGRVIDDKTPITVSDLVPGNHVVKLSKDKYNDLRFDVEIVKGEKKEIPVKKLELAEVELTFNTQPQGRKVVLLDGEKRIDIGITPAKYQLPTNVDYNVEYDCGNQKVLRPLEKSSFLTGSDTVSLPAVDCGTEAPAVTGGTTPRIRKPQATDNNQQATPPPSNPVVKQQPAAAGGEGFLSVQTKPWSKVYINGTFIRNTPVIKKALKAGTYNIMVENPEFGIKRQFSVTIKAGQTTTLVKKLI